MKKLFTLILLLLVSPAHAIETTAKHAFMVDANTGAVLFNKDGTTPMTPSSMSKLMTAYIAFERLRGGRIGLEDKFPVSEKAWKMQGSKTFVKVGDEISVNDLLHGIIVQSGNDACIVLAEGISGSEEAFVEEMNKKAEELGLKQSHFKNATGWPDEGHVMSAKDLAILSLRIINNFPEYYPFYATKEYKFNNIMQLNRNRLLGGDLGVDGLKTGHTEDAGYGIALSAKQGDRRLILVINGLTSDDERVKEGDKLLRWGFSEFTNKTLVSANTEVARAKVWLGDEEEVSLVSPRDIVTTVPVNSTATPNYILRYQAPLAAPVDRDTHVADLVIQSEEVTQVVPLVAANSVEKATGFGKAWAVIKHYVGR